MASHLLHFNLLSQQGMAAKMSKEYIVPRMRAEPFQRALQKAQRRMTDQPSRQPMHTAAKYCCRPSTRTGMADLACWIGVRKKVPSNSGYRSKTRSGWWQRTHAVLDVLWAASVDRMKQRVSSLPCRPSSSILMWYELILWRGRTLKLLKSGRLAKRPPPEPCLLLSEKKSLDLRLPGAAW